jgi:OOP family OmpA-OmpF porin
LSSGSLAVNNTIFIFSAETYGTRGVDDIYISKFENGSWTEPQNLGSSINTKFQELSPSLSDDGKTLYFSSNGRKGQGSFDVYASTRLDNSWTSWSTPVNLGTEVNSEGRELFFRNIPDSENAIFTSTKNSDGYGDIKLNHVNNPKPQIDTLTVPVNNIDTTATVAVENPVQPVVDNQLIVYGKITDSKTGQPVDAKIVFTSPGAESALIEKSLGGNYKILILSGQSYHIAIEAHGYISAFEKLEPALMSSKEIEMNFALQPVEVGTVVNLKSVLFAQGKTELLSESYDELDLVVSFLKENSHVKIELSGHTDNRGVQADNIRLSQQRVNTVKAYLVSKGIDPKRITGKGYGGAKPISSNDTEETRKLNRRVEFTIRKL